MGAQNLVSLFEALNPPESDRMSHETYDISASLPPPWASFPQTMRGQPSPTSPYSSSSEGTKYESTTISGLSSPNSSPDSSPRIGSRKDRFSQSLRRVRSRSGSPYTMRSSFSFKVSNLLLRRRPSAVDLVLSEERSRCCEDTVEKRGLGLMEPRPVDPLPLSVQMDSGIGEGQGFAIDALNRYGDSAHNCRPPRFVMGGIFEVMEGKA